MYPGPGGRAQTVTKWLPGVARFRGYDRSWLRGDIVAGLILVALLVPQGMAYAELAGLPPVNGLYASMIPLLAYAVIGPSRILVLAPDSAVSPLIAAAIIPIAGSNDPQRVALAGLLALMVGAICFVAGVLGAGFVTDLISRPVRVGYLAGIALTVIASQIPAILGIPRSGERIGDILRSTANNIDQADLTTLAIGLGSLAVLLCCKRFWPRLPGALVVVIGGILLQRFAALDIKVVGTLPSGLPQFAMPDAGGADLGRLALSAAAISVIAFADTSVLSRSYAKRLGDDIDSNQELRALGVANAATGFFQGFPLSSSSSRTPVAEDLGSKSQLTGVIGAIGLGAILLFASGAFRNLPSATLSAILISAAIGLFELDEFKRLRAIYRPDFYLAVAALVGVSIFGVLWGIGIAIVLSILAFLWRAWHPHIAILGRAPGVKGYHDVTRYPTAEQIPGLLLLRFDAPIFFANADLFHDAVLRAIADSPEPIRRVVIAGEPITDLDSTAADMLNDLDQELTARNIELAFAELRDPMKDRLTDFGLVEQFGREQFYPTLGLAVRDYVTEEEVEWIDWEERMDVEERA